MPFFLFHNNHGRRKKLAVGKALLLIEETTKRGLVFGVRPGGRAGKSLGSKGKEERERKAREEMGSRTFFFCFVFSSVHK